MSAETQLASDDGWCFRLPGEPARGPVSARALARLAQSGELTPFHLVSNGRGWHPASAIKGLNFPPTLTAVSMTTNSPSQKGAIATKPPRFKAWHIAVAAICLTAVAILIDRQWIRAPASAHAEPAVETPNDKSAALTTPRRAAPSPASSPKLALPIAPILPAETEQQMIARVSKSVVTVRTTSPTSAGHGSGFFVRDQRTIVTNFHVIDGATTVSVQLSDGTTLKAEGFLRAIPEFDIALIRLAEPATGVMPLQLHPSEPSQGERVIAFGSPEGLTNSVSDGIVSAIRSGSELGDFFQPGELGASPTCRWIQVTAPISHGSSGGPLVDALGRVSGVNSMVLRPNDSQNLNLAVASSIVRDAIETEHQLQPLSALPFVPLPISGFDDASRFVSGTLHDTHEMSRHRGREWSVPHNTPDRFTVTFKLPSRWSQIEGKSAIGTRHGKYSISVTIWSTDRSETVNASDVRSALLASERELVEQFADTLGMHLISLESSTHLGLICTKKKYLWDLDSEGAIRFYQRYAVVKGKRMVFADCVVTGPSSETSRVAKLFASAGPVFDVIFESVQLYP